MIRAGVRADKRQQGMIAGSHFSSLFSLSLSPWPPRENLPPATRKSHLSSVLSPSSTTTVQEYIFNEVFYLVVVQIVFTAKGCT